MTMIQQAILNGGVLTVRLAPYAFFIATMSWDSEGKKLDGCVGVSVDAAISKLEDALVQNCADEMYDEGRAV